MTKLHYYLMYKQKINVHSCLKSALTVSYPDLPTNTQACTCDISYHLKKVEGLVDIAMISPGHSFEECLKRLAS